MQGAYDLNGSDCLSFVARSSKNKPERGNQHYQRFLLLTLCPIEFRDYEIFMILWQLIHYRSTLYALLKYLKSPIF